MDLIHVLVAIILFLVHQRAVSAIDHEFTFNGFRGANITLDGTSKITTNGVLQLSSDTHNLAMGHAFYPSPIRLRTSSSSSSSSSSFKNSSQVLSFSSCFVFAILTQVQNTGGHGFAFTLSPSPMVAGARGANFLGLFNQSNLANATNHIFAVEFDTAQDMPFSDIDDNHVGVDINTLNSTVSATASYFPSDNSPQQIINLQSGNLIHAWIDYHGGHQHINVSIAPVSNPIKKPTRPLLSINIDLSHVIEEFMYVGFSSGTGKLSSNHYILGWSFALNGEARLLDLSHLPLLPTTKSRIRVSKIVEYTVSTATILISLLFITCYILYRRRKNLLDIMEGWELEYPHRFSYRELYVATKGFKEKELLGSGGFGGVYKGVLPETHEAVAVKRVSHTAKQGLREFVAEISSLGRLRHRNVVQLQGWCRRQGELLLVYDFMPNSSLDSFLFDDTKAKNLSWEQRFKILKGIASGLLYLHDGWEQVVVHRDVKASNVLLDGEMNGRLGDFGLARLHEHGKNPQTTRVVGTLGYMAPELSRTGKATASADVFSFGALLLEVASGKRPIEMWRSVEDEEMTLVERVAMYWQREDILRIMDARLEGRFVREEAELVLKLGVLCSNALPEKRPMMRQVVQYLDGDVAVPQDYHGMVGFHGVAFGSFDQLVLACPSSNVPSSNFAASPAYDYAASYFQ